MNVSYMESQYIKTVLEQLFFYIIVKKFTYFVILDLLLLYSYLSKLFTNIIYFCT